MSNPRPAPRERNEMAYLARGQRFYHSRVLTENNEPQLYEITRVAVGRVYYRPVYDEPQGTRLGGMDCCRQNDFERYCLEMIAQ
jgi:hypothetical protein